MLDWIGKDSPAWEYLPTREETLRLTRQYVINIIYTAVGEPFEAWVNEMMEVRNEAVAGNNDLDIDIAPEFLEAFEASTHHSSKSSLNKIY